MLDTFRQPQQQQPYYPQAQFSSAHTRAQLAKALLLANAALAVVSLLSNIYAASSSAANVAVLEEEINPVELLQGLIGLAQVFVYLATIVIFLVWLHRAYKNLPAFGVQTEQSPGWAVGSWFIPFLNLVRPYQIVKETWIKSDPGVSYSSGYADAGPVARSAALVGVWWAFWLLSNVVGNFYGRVVWDAETAEQLSAAATLGIVSDLLNVVSAVLAFLVVKTIDRMQEEKAARLNVAAWPTPPPPPVSFDAPPAAH